MLNMHDAFVQSDPHYDSKSKTRSKSRSCFRARPSEQRVAAHDNIDDMKRCAVQKSGHDSH